MTAPIAYIAPEFPRETQTFIYREVQSLRERGWTVVTVSLKNPPIIETPTVAKIGEGTIRVYGAGLKKTLAASARELLSRPARTLKTLFGGVRDALAPRESTGMGSRFKLIGQSVAGIGLAAELRRRGVRHIHAHFTHSPTSVAMYAARQLDITFSCTGHANDLFQRRNVLRRKLERVAFVACISRWHEQFYRSIAPAAKPDYRLIRCGVDIDGWKPPVAPSGNETAPLRVLTVCRLVEKKGIDLLIRALGAMRGSDWMLTVAGDGPDTEKLQALAGELGCADRIRWLGLVTNAKIPALLNEADVFALPCRTDSAGDRDGIPVVFMESLACGVPVVSGDLPAIRELIDDGVSGILISDPQSPTGIAAMTDALARLAHDPALRHRLGQAGRRKVEEEFSMTRNLDILEQALRDATK